MATVVFYQKPGCATNARQKRMLELAGHTVIARDLLTEPWTAERLRAFFGGTPVASWFNAAAPRVKSGAIDPERMDAEGAVALMLAEPLQIRRPLVDAGAEKCAGFDREPVTSLLTGGGQTPRINALGSGTPDEARGLTPSLEGCARPQASAPCPPPDQPGKTAHP